MIINLDPILVKNLAKLTSQQLESFLAKNGGNDEFKKKVREEVRKSYLSTLPTAKAMNFDLEITKQKVNLSKYIAPNNTSDKPLGGSILDVLTSNVKEIVGGVADKVLGINYLAELGPRIEPLTPYQSIMAEQSGTQTGKTASALSEEERTRRQLVLLGSIIDISPPSLLTKGLKNLPKNLNILYEKLNNNLNKIEATGKSFQDIAQINNPGFAPKS